MAAADFEPWNPKTNRPIRIALAAWAPNVFPCSLENEGTLKRIPMCKFPGTSHEILAHILEMANISYELIPMDPAGLDWGRNLGGQDGPCKWSGLLGSVYNGTIDTVGVEYNYIKERLRCFAFSTPTVYDSGVLVYKASGDFTGRLGALFYVFTPNIWMITMATILFLTLFFTVNAQVFAIEPKEKERKFHDHFRESFWTIVQTITDQAGQIPVTFAAQTWTARYLLSLLGLFAIFFLKLYEGGLLTSLLLEREVKPFRNVYELTDLVAAGESSYMIEEGAWYEGYVVDEGITSLNGMREAFKSTPMLRARSPKAALQAIREADQGEIVYAGSYSTVRQDIEADCNLKFIFDYDIPSVRMGFVFSERNPALVRALSDNIYRSQSHTEWIYRRYFSDNVPKNCLIPDQTIRVSNLAGIFVLSAMVGGLSILAFLYELLIGRGLKSKREVSPTAAKLKSRPPTRSAAKDQAVFGAGNFKQRNQRPKKASRKDRDRPGDQRMVVQDLDEAWVY